jgi:hypothetical protein
VTYTNQQIRGAILRAADTIERDPGLWNWNNTDVPRNDCGTPACALGWIGFHLGIRRYCAGSDLSASASVEQVSPVLMNGSGSFAFYDAMREIDLEWRSTHAHIAPALRKFADRYFPAEAADKSEQLDPAYLAFKRAFVNAVEAA